LHFQQKILEFTVNIRRILGLGVILAAIPVLSGCWMAVAAGAGAYGGYKMKENGYTTQNPITKEKSSQKDSE
jgi:hypothetical protein